MKCCECKEFYDLDCLKICDSNFKNFSQDFLNNWVCPACLSMRPKSNNICTPVRSMVTHTNCDNININMSRGSRIKTTPPQTAYIEKDIYSSPNIHLELKYLKEEVTELKKQNGDIINILSTVSLSMKQILSEYDLGLKTKDKEIMLLKESVAQLQNKLTLYENHEAANSETNNPIPEMVMPICNESLLPSITAKENMSQICTDNLGMSLSEPINHQNEKENNANPNVAATQGWTKVSYKRPRSRTSNILHGTATPGSTLLEASDRFIYLHLYYVKSGTKENQVLDHLKTISNSDAFTVEALKARGQYASFKIGVPAKLAECIMNAKNWTEDICIKHWSQNFRSRKNNKE